MEKIQILSETNSLAPTEYVIGTRADLENEHSLLLARVQQIRQKLGWELLPTGKQQRKTQARRQ